jgi:hypothetical protein
VIVVGYENVYVLALGGISTDQFLTTLFLAGIPALACESKLFQKKGT